MRKIPKYGPEFLHIIIFFLLLENKAQKFLPQRLFCG